MLVLSLPAFENKKYAAYDRFHGNGPYGEIPTKKEPIRTLEFTLPYNKDNYFLANFIARFIFNRWRGNDEAVYCSVPERSTYLVRRRCCVVIFYC